MKISKIFAGMSAAALAASMMSLAAFAADPVKAEADLSGGVISLIDETDKEGNVTKTGLLTGTGVAVTDVYGVDINVTVGADTAAAIEAGDWVGGGMGYNSESTGWASTEWSFQDGAKDITAAKAEDGSYDFVIKGDAAAFADTDTYAQVWLQNWSTSDFTFNAFTLLDKNGDPLVVVTNPAGGNSVDLSDYDATELALSGDGVAKVDNGIARVNIHNPWAADEDKIITPADLQGANAIAVTADISGIVDPVDFAINFAVFSDGAPAFWGDGNSANSGCTTDTITVNADGTYTFLIKFDSALDVTGDLFMDLQTNFAADSDDAIPFAVKVTSVKALTDKEPAPTPSDSDSDSDSDTELVDSVVDSTADSKTESTTDSKATDSKGTTSSKAANNASNTNPSTGAAALAAVGVALAGAAVVATKKRK